MKNWIKLFAPLALVATVGISVAGADGLSSNTLPGGGSETFLVSPVTLTQSSAQIVQAGNAISCNDGAGHHTDNSYYRRYDLDGDHTITGPWEVTSVSFGVEHSFAGLGGTQPVSVIIYTIPAAAPLLLANLTQIGQTNIQIARLVLGLIFFMAGIFKVFDFGPLEHARRFFIPYQDTFLPVWSLWLVGTAIPFVELVAGGLIMIGWRIRWSLISLGSVLAIVTFGHLLKEPLYPFHEHVIPRLALVLFVLMMPPAMDRFSIDSWLERRASSRER